MYVSIDQIYIHTYNCIAIVACKSMLLYWSKAYEVRHCRLIWLSMMSYPYFVLFPFFLQNKANNSWMECSRRLKHKSLACRQSRNCSPKASWKRVHSNRWNRLSLQLMPIFCKISPPKVHVSEVCMVSETWIRRIGDRFIAEDCSTRFFVVHGVHVSKSYKSIPVWSRNENPIYVVGPHVCLHLLAVVNDSYWY